MKSVLSAATAGLAMAAAPKWNEVTPSYTYEAWLSDFAPRHPGTKEAFAENLARIIAHNADATATWKAGVNQWTGLTRAEFGKVVKGFTRGAKPLGASLPHDSSKEVPLSALPASLDWREKGVVTKVKDQGQCGGCWTFSTSETLESHIAINTGKLMTFSEQALIDCVPNPDQCGGTGGCSGATQELAFNWTIGAGITTEASYPYTAVTGTCDMSKVVPVATITGYAELPPNNYTALMNAVVNIGPIAISAAAEPWQIYSEGVFNSDCGTDVDHAIVLEGYGTDNSGAKPMDYWLVRNSWGAGWGEKGYIRLARYGSTAKGEPCGTDNTPGDGDGCKGGPASIQVCGLCGILSDSSYPIGGKLV